MAGRRSMRGAWLILQAMSAHHWLINGHTELDGVAGSHCNDGWDDDVQSSVRFGQPAGDAQAQCAVLRSFI